MNLAAIWVGWLGMACTPADDDTTSTPTSTSATDEAIPIEVFVYDDVEQPVADVDVVVSNPDGSLRAHTRSGPDGWVTVNMPPEGFLSVLNEASAVIGDNARRWRWVHSVHGLQRGDVFRVQVAVSDPPYVTPEVMQITVQLSETCSLPSTVERVLVQASCGGLRDVGASDEVVLAEAWACPGRDDYDVYAYALDADDFRVGVGALLDRPFSPNGSATHTICPDTRDALETILILNDHTDGQVAAQASVSGWRKGSAATSDRRYTDVAPDPYVVAGRLPAGVFDAYSWQMGADASALTQVGFSSVTVTEQGLTALPEVIEWSMMDAALVDVIEDLDVSDPVRPELRWSLTSSGALGTVVEATASWAGDTETDFTIWESWAPAEREGGVRFPELPEGLAVYRPSAGAAVENLLVVHVGADGVDGVGDYLRDPSSDRTFIARGNVFP